MLPCKSNTITIYAHRLAHRSSICGMVSQPLQLKAQVGHQPVVHPRVNRGKVNACHTVISYEVLALVVCPPVQAEPAVKRPVLYPEYDWHTQET